MGCQGYSTLFPSSFISFHFLSVRVFSFQIPHRGSADGLITDVMERENLPRKLPPSSYPRLNICCKLTHSSCLEDSDRSGAVKSAGAKLESWLCHLQLTDLGQLLNFSKADSTSVEGIFRRLVPGGRRYQCKMYTQSLTLSEFPCSPQTQTEWRGPHEWCRQWGRQCMLSDDCPSDLLVIMLFCFSWNQL